MKNRVKQKLIAGQNVYGTFLWSSSETITECAGYAGLDFGIIDCEHSPLETEGAVKMIRAAKLSGMTPFVRVKDTTRPSILKMLDAGAEALIIPCLKTIDEVKRIVEYGKYQPIGQRGFAQSREANFGYAEYAKDWNNYFSVSNAETLLLPMCETKEFLNQLESIVSMEGVDGIFVGPYDLSVALGKPGVFDTKEFSDSLRYVTGICQKHKKFSFIFSDSTDSASIHRSLGYQGMALGTDVGVLIKTYTEMLTQVKTV